MVEKPIMLRAKELIFKGVSTPFIKGLRVKDGTGQGHGPVLGEVRAAHGQGRHEHDTLA